MRLISWTHPRGSETLGPGKRFLKHGLNFVSVQKMIFRYQKRAKTGQFQTLKSATVL